MSRSLTHAPLFWGHSLVICKTLFLLPLLPLYEYGRHQEWILYMVTLLVRSLQRRPLTIAPHSMALTLSLLSQGDIEKRLQPNQAGHGL